MRRAGSRPAAGRRGAASAVRSGRPACLAAAAALVLAGLPGVPARAAAPGGLALWGPRGARPPAPFEVAVVRRDHGHLVPVGRPAIHADGGRAVAAPGGDPDVLRLRLVPAPGATRITLHAGAGASAVSRTWPLDPGVAGRISVSVSPDHLVKRPGASATVTVQVLDATGHPLAHAPPPVVSANVGRVGPLAAAGAGRFQATYTPGPARYPEVAVITAFRPWPHAGRPAVAVGQAVLPLSAAIDLPGTTRPNVQMTVVIAGRRFGPVHAGRHGKFKVPVVVPPGHGRAEGIAVDRFGNHRRTRIDLHLPPTNRLAVAAQPTRLVADGHARAQVVLFVVDPFGHPETGRPPVLEADRGRVTAPVSVGPGRWRAWYLAPLGVGPGRAHLSVHFGRRDPSRATVAISLVPGAPATVAASVSPAVVPAPSKTPATVTLAVRDGAGQPVPGPRVVATAHRGHLGAPAATATGARLAYHPPPTPKGWSDTVHLRVSALPGKRAVAAGWAAGHLWLLDPVGRPVPGARARLAGVRAKAHAAEVTADGDGAVTVPGDGDLIVALAPGLPPVRVHRARDARGRIHGWPEAPAPVVATLKVPLMAPPPAWVEVDVAPAPGGKTTVRWKVEGAPGVRKVAIVVGRAAPVRAAGRAGTLVVPAKPGTPVTVTDLETGVAAVATVPGR